MQLLKTFSFLVLQSYDYIDFLFQLRKSILNFEKE